MTGIETRHVDPANAEQASAWDGEEGAYWARHADLFEQSTGRYDGRMLEAAGLTETSRVIDVGCGSGDTARAAAAAAPDGSVLGIDLSGPGRGRPPTSRAGRPGQPAIRPG